MNNLNVKILLLAIVLFFGSFRIADEKKPPLKLALLK